jgi:hypothetical protein
MCKVLKVSSRGYYRYKNKIILNKDIEVTESPKSGMLVYQISRITLVKYMRVRFTKEVRNSKLS